MKVLNPLAAFAVTTLAACAAVPPPAADVPATTPPPVTGAAPKPPVVEATAPKTLDALAIGYVKLVLAMGELDADYVDAYYGPAEWRAAIKAQPQNAKQIASDAQRLLDVIEHVNGAGPETDPALVALRKDYLKAQLKALLTRARQLDGLKLSFDDEARALYDTEAPKYTDAQFEPALKRIEKLLPRGRGTLAERYNRYLDRYSVPKEKLEAVMQTAIAAARKTTGDHIALPAGENFTLSLVHDKPWSAYNWYQGGYVSKIEVNTALPVAASRVIDLAAHEGYPGHHVYNALLEAKLVNGQHWPEFQVYALFSPQSLIAEGSADYGASLAFPQAEKLGLTRKLFKQAGFDPRQAATYLAVLSATHELAPAGLEAARRYLDGTMTPEQTSAWLERYTLASPERAKQRLRFFDKYRAYAINYSWGEQVVRRYVEAKGGKVAGSAAQWQVFADLLSTPRTPSGITVDAPH